MGAREIVFSYFRNMRGWRRRILSSGDIMEIYFPGGKAI
jgi:hypothetical protein